MPTNDLHRACGCVEGSNVEGNYKKHDPDWGRAGALLGLGEGADPHPDAKRLCAEKGGLHDQLPLQLAVENKAPRSVLERIEAAHPLEQWALTVVDVLTVASVEAFAPKVLKLITPEACAEWDRGMLPLHWALTNKAPKGVALAIIDAHPQVRGHAEPPCHVMNTIL